jgi:hypothetical protein
MAAVPTPAQRLGLRATALAQEASLAVLVRGALGPLPAPRRPLPAAGEGLGGLWRALSALPLGGRSESGFESTSRVVKHDAWRKHADQVSGLAGRGPTPAGWEEIDGEPMGGGRAPLHALFRPPAAGRPIVLLIHGLYDSKRSRYVLLAADALARSGCGVLLPDMRWHGCLLSPDWLPALGLEESLDLLRWARWAGGRHPGHAAGLLGFSLGALSVIHAAGRAEAAETLTAGAVAVSPPVVLDRTARTLDAEPRFADVGLNAFILKLFQRFLRLRLAQLGITGDLERPFAHFVDWLAPRLSGVAAGLTGERLLDLADPGPALAACHVPLLLVAARNDPIFSELTAAELARRVKANPYVHLVETPGGGHVGHLGTYPAWMAEVLHLFFGTTPRLLPRPDPLPM